MATAIERLKAEIREEKRMKQALEESTGELATTIRELEEGLTKIETDANEWQLRYETQLEKNQQLDMQARQLEEDIKNAKQSKASASVPANDVYQDMSDTNLKQLLKQLLAEKKELERELKDYEWRLDRESKAFYRADEDRRVQMSELAHAQLLLSEGQGRKRQSLNRRQKDREQKLSKHLAETVRSTSKRNSAQSTTSDKSSPENDRNHDLSVSEHEDSPDQQSKPTGEIGNNAAVDEI